MYLPKRHARGLEYDVHVADPILRVPRAKVAKRRYGYRVGREEFRSR